jgi:tRNA threonylcarbamoyl adenosine modification protein YeaZ
MPETVKYALGLHTTTPELALCLDNFAGEQRCQTWDLGRDLSIYLHTHLQTFLYPLTWQDLSWLAVARGPGSFTGTRMGVVTARTLAQQLEIPVFAISTLAAIAWTVCQQQSPAPTLTAPTLITVALPAQRGQTYGAVYQSDPARTSLLLHTPEQVFDLADWQQLVRDINHQSTCVSVGPDQVPDIGSLCQAMLVLAAQEWQQGKRPHWSTALPFYGQSPV